MSWLVQIRSLDSRFLLASMRMKCFKCFAAGWWVGGDGGSEGLSRLCHRIGLQVKAPTPGALREYKRGQSC